MINLKDADLDQLRFSALKGRYTTEGNITSVDATEDELNRAYPGWWNKKYSAAEMAREKMFSCEPKRGAPFVTVNVKTFIDGEWNGERAYSFSPEMENEFNSASAEWAAAKGYELKVTKVAEGECFKPVDNTNFFFSE